MEICHAEQTAQAPHYRFSRRDFSGLARRRRRSDIDVIKRHGSRRKLWLYAPRGDCSRGASLEINETGFTFKASGQTVKSTRFEYAASFLGPTYEGVSAVFFPFPVNANDFGRVILTVNDDEKRGVVRLEADVAPGQRLDPFKSALVSQSPLLLCKGSGPASAASKAPLQARPVLGKPTPLAWTNLASSIGKFQSDSDPNGIDLLTSGPIADAIRSRLGRKIDLLASNLRRYPVSNDKDLSIGLREMRRIKAV